MYVQKILFGSPGTGKSHRIDHEILPNVLGINKQSHPQNVIKTVFHPEYSYGDFVGKLVPITKGGKIEYNFYEGHFLRALSQAYKNLIDASKRSIDSKDGQQVDPDHVALVIDELNRGNSSAIFGTIFQLLDRNDNGWSSYSININEIEFNKLLELIGVKFNYTDKGNISGYKLAGHEEVSKLESLQKKIEVTHFDLINKTIQIPCNLSIIGTMNTSDSSIYYMDSAFKRRWDWEYMDIDSNVLSVEGIAFNTRSEWEKFLRKLNNFIKNNHRYIRGIEDKQIGLYFLKSEKITKADIQNKLMFALWDNVFSRDKKPLSELLFGPNPSNDKELITFGDFVKQIDLFLKQIMSR